MAKRQIKKYINKARIGNDEAFDQLIDIIKMDIYKIAKSRLLNEEDTLDAVQESIISMYENICKLRNVNKFYNWMTIIVINACNDIAKKRSKNIEEFNEEIIDKDSKEKKEFNDSLINKLILEEALSKIDKDDRMLLMFYYSEGYSAKEIEKLTGIKENTVRSKIMRAKEKIKEFYKEQEVN
ncbi:MAG: sigma-70 family RNA polymerase sigma factor [Clostridia bacterium]|nr:sigma-70 family RNA polymerase sigma factor [Clostridia bacterium]